MSGFAISQTRSGALFIIAAAVLTGAAAVKAPAACLAALLLIAAVTAVFVKPMLGVMVLVATTPFVSIANIPLFNIGGQTAPFTLNDLLLPVVITGWLLRKLTSGRLLLDSTAKWAALFVLLDIISISVNSLGLAPRELMVAALYLVRWIQYATLYLIVKDSLTTQRQAHKLVRALVLSAFVVSVLGFIQLALFPNLSQLTALAGGEVSSFANLDLHSGRLVSVFLEPNHLAGYLLIYIAISLAFVIDARERRGRWIWLVILVTFLVALVLTQSRAAFIGLAALGVVLSKGKSRKPVLVVAAILLVSMVCSPRVSSKLKGMFVSDMPLSETITVAGITLTPDESASSRIRAWMDAGKVIARYPFVGCGYNAYRFGRAKSIGEQTTESRGEAGAANSYLTLLATTGVPGFLVYLGLLIGIYRQFSRMRKSRTGTPSGTLAAATAASVAAVAFHATTIESLFFPQTMFSLWLLTGAASAAEKLPDEEIQD